MWPKLSNRKYSKSNYQLKTCRFGGSYMQIFYKSMIILGKSLQSRFYLFASDTLFPSLFFFRLNDVQMDRQIPDVWNIFSLATSPDYNQRQQTSNQAQHYRYIFVRHDMQKNKSISLVSKTKDWALVQTAALVLEV